MSPQQRAGVYRAHARGQQLSPMSRRQYDVAVLDLSLARLPAQLTNRFSHAGQVAEVVTGEQAAAGIDRDAAAGPDRAALDKRAALALFAPAVVFELEQNLAGKAVIKLRAIDVVEFEPSLPERLFLGAQDRHVGEILLLPPQLGGDLVESLAENVDRRLRTILRPFGRGENESDAAVGHKADVE